MRYWIIVLGMILLLGGCEIQPKPKEGDLRIQGNGSYVEIQQYTHKIWARPEGIWLPVLGFDLEELEKIHTFIAYGVVRDSYSGAYFVKSECMPEAQNGWICGKNIPKRKAELQRKLKSLK